DPSSPIVEAAPVIIDAVPTCPPPPPTPPTDSTTGTASADRVLTKAPPTPVVPSSQESSSPSGSDRPSPTGEVEKTAAKQALHNLESATGVHVSHVYRSTMVDYCLALGKRDALENLRQALSCWRKPAGVQRSGVLALECSTT